MKISVCAFMDINGDSFFYTGEYIEESMFPIVRDRSRIKILGIEPGYLELLRCGCSAFYTGNSGKKWTPHKCSSIYCPEKGKGK